MKFSKQSIDQLKVIYQEILEKSDWSGSARGSHYTAMKWLKDHDIKRQFQNNRMLEDYLGHIVTYGETPDDSML